MRIRTIKPDFFIHGELFDLEKETGLPIRISFAGLWCAADREGRFQWSPRELGIQIVPYDCVDFSRVLDALLTRGFLVKYASQGREYGLIPSFLRHQIINNRESASVLPDPEECDVMGLPTREARVDHARGTPHEGKGREGKGIEGKGKEEKTTRQAAFVPPSESEWVAYCTSTWPDWSSTTAAEAWAYYESKKWKGYSDWKKVAVTAHGKARDWGTLQPKFAQRDFRQPIPEQKIVCRPGELDGIDIESVGRL